MTVRRGHALIVAAMAIAISTTPLVVGGQDVARGQSSDSVGVDRTVTSGTPVRRQSVRALETEVAEPADFESPLLPTTDPSEYAAAKEAAATGGSTGFRSTAPEPAGTPAEAALKVKGVNRNGVQSPAATAATPDPHGAAGLEHFVEVVNRRVFVIKKANPQKVTTDVSLAAFFGYDTQPLFHPQVVFDHRKERWIVTAAALPESPTVQWLFVAVSTGRNPNGNFDVYQLNVTGDPGSFLDRPMLGYNKRAIVMTANVFAAPPPSVGAYLETDVLVVPKQAAYAGEPLNLEILSVGATGSLAPPIVLDGDDDVFLLQAKASGNEIPLWRGTRFGLSSPALSLIHDVPVPQYSIPPDAPQPDTDTLLDTADGRFLDASTQYGSRLWNVHTINEIGLATPRFYEIRTNIGVAEQVGGFWATEASSTDFNASIAANKNGDAFVTWTSTDETLGVNAEVRFSGRLRRDPRTVIRLPGEVLVGSPSFFDPTGGPVARWGDHASVSLDPASYGSCPKHRRAWIVNETIRDADTWGSRIGRIGFC